MRLKLSGDYGFVGTHFIEYVKVPKDLSPEQIEAWAEEEAKQYWEQMCERMSLGYKIIE